MMMYTAGIIFYAEMQTAKGEELAQTTIIFCAQKLKPEEEKGPKVEKTEKEK